MSLEKKILKAIDSETQTKMLCKHQPTGKMWGGVYNPNTNIGKLMLGLGVEFYRLGLLTEKFLTEDNIDTTTELGLLEEWEESVGIPHSIFQLESVSLAARRTNIKYLLTNFWGVQIAADFERVASYYGYEVIVNGGMYYAAFPIGFPMVFFGSDKIARFTIVVNVVDQPEDYFFALDFPLDFSSGGAAFLQELMELLAPANCDVLLQNI